MSLQHSNARAIHAGPSRTILSLARYVGALSLTIALTSSAHAQQFHYGRVAARGMVLRNQAGQLDLAGKPSWVEYVDDPGNVIENDDGYAKALPPSVARDQSLVPMSVPEYNSRNPEHPYDTAYRSLLVLVSPDDRPPPQVKYASKGQIGRETALMYGGLPDASDGLDGVATSVGCAQKPDPNSKTIRTRNDLDAWNFMKCAPARMVTKMPNGTSQALVWNPVIGADIEIANFGAFRNAKTDGNGHYFMSVPNSLYGESTYDVNATVQFINFNPRVPSSKYFYMTSRSNVAGSGVAQFSNFPMEVGLVRVRGIITNGDQGGIVPMVGFKFRDGQLVGIDQSGNPVATRYQVTPTVAGSPHRGLLKQISGLDLAETELYVYRAADGRLIGSRYGLYNNEIGVIPAADNDPNTPEEYTQLPAMFVMTALIRGAASSYTGLVPPSYNPATYGAFPIVKDGKVVVQQRFGLEVDYASGTDAARNAYLRAGDLLKLIVINRATGYMGSGQAIVAQSISGTTVTAPDGGPVAIELKPPKLRVTVERNLSVEQGATRGEQRKYIVGFEGSALKSDNEIKVITEWTDQDGTPLPTDLPGLTGRFAQILDAQVANSGAGNAGGGGQPPTDPNTVLVPTGGNQKQAVTLQNGCQDEACDQVGLFEIKPGTTTVIAQLKGDMKMGHFYVHVDGQPRQRSVEFTQRPGPSSKPDFSVRKTCIETEAGPDGNEVEKRRWTCVEGAGDEQLQYRPITYVPFLTPFWPTGEAQPQKQATTTQTPDVSHVEPAWYYRPEMQYSVLTLGMQHMYVKNEQGNDRDILQTASTLESQDDRLRLVFDLLRDPITDLPRLSGDRNLVFKLGNQTYPAQLTTDPDTGDQTLEFQNLSALRNASNEDMLVLRLLQSGDESNVLWEYRFNDAKIILADGKASVAPGAQAKAMVKANPEWHRVQWTAVESEEGVLATIEPTTGIIKADKESKEGFFTIKATNGDRHPSGKGATAVARIPIGCECLTCKAEGTCSTKAGSVDARFELGLAPGGGGAGQIVLHTETLTAESYTPRALTLDTLTLDTDAPYDQNGLRQVSSTNGFVDIQRSDADTYLIRYFPKSAQGQFNTGSKLYDFDPAAVPTTVWKIDNPDQGSLQRLRITGDPVEGRDGPDIREFRIVDGVTTLYEGLSAEPGGPQNVKPLRTEEKSETRAGALRTVRATIKDQDGNPAAVTESTYETFQWDGKSVERVIEEVIDPGGAALTTRYAYYSVTDPGLGKRTGRLASVENHDGSWVKYNYDTYGRLQSEMRPWLDSEITAPTSEVRVTEYDYTPLATVDILSPTHLAINRDDDDDFETPRTVTEKIKGIVVGKTFFSISRPGDGTRVETEERCVRQGCHFGDDDNLRTITRYHAPDVKDPQANDGGQLASIQQPDGRMDTYTYERGRVSGGAFSPGAGDAQRVTITHGIASSPAGVAYRTTQDVSVTDEHGQSVRDEQYVYTGGAYELLSSSEQKYDQRGNLMHTLKSNGEVSTSQWGCCGERGNRDSRGIETTYERDALNRVVREERSGITTSYVYDPVGRVVRMMRRAGELQSISTTRYDAVGRVEESIDEQGLVTRFGYDTGGLLTVVTRPGGFTDVTSQYADGQLRSTTGTATVPQFFSYGVEQNGLRVTERRAARNDSPAFVRTFTDMVGRTRLVERPGFGDTLEATETEYNARGQVVRLRVPGRAATLYEHDMLGARIRIGLDLNGNEQLDLASDDRITEASWNFANINGEWWMQSEQRVYPQNGSATAVRTNSVRTRLSGLNPTLLQEQVDVDAHDNETRSVVSIDPSSRTESKRIDLPDSDSDIVTTIVAGRLLSTTSKTGLKTEYDYDALGRLTGVIEPRTGRREIRYDAAGRVESTMDAAGNTTRFEYDPATGRKSRECNALGKCSYFAYDDHGAMTRTWGDVPYPVEYVYDEFGRRIIMRTFRQELAWASPRWPNGSGTHPGDPPRFDETRWVYESATGLLLESIDAAGNGPKYTYGPEGRLASRTWARRLPDGAPLITRYVYDEKTAELAAVEYSDDTPGVKYVFDRLGRHKTITDGTGTRSFGYDSQTLELIGETLGGDSPSTLVRGYNSNGLSGRLSSLSYGDYYSVNHGYDGQGRVKTISWNVRGREDAATYAYIADAELLSGVATTNGQAASYSYEPARDLTTKVENQFRGVLVSQYEYAYDAIQRRTSVRNSGSAFALPELSTWTYDDRNELIATRRLLGGTLSGGGGAVQSEATSYKYDPVGNRTAVLTQDGTAPTLYNANPLNQYTAIDSVEADYDSDGNLLRRGDLLLAYDSENQLTRAEVLGRTISTFSYDYIGRRTGKKVKVLDGAARDYSMTWVYSGWQPIEERRTENGTTTIANLIWGLDLSQRPDGAEGVGGLLAAVAFPSTETTLFAYDANGNVVDVIDGTLNRNQTHYQYDAFGNLPLGLFDDGTGRQVRFSTKYADAETGLYYYGYRYYHPMLGRWITRDPIGHAGAINMYGFVGNDPIGRLDTLGLYDEAVHYYTAFEVAYLVYREQGNGTAEANQDARRRALELAYYSQLPDEEEAYDATATRKGDWLGTVSNEWADKVNDYLHSLHGGSAADVKRVRCCLSRLIQDKNPARRLQPWEKGFLLHAYADSFAHTDSTGAAYAKDWGHAWKNVEESAARSIPILGRLVSARANPDQIVNRPSLYKDYVSNLYTTLGGQNMESLDIIFSAVDQLGVKKGQDAASALGAQWIGPARTYLPETGEVFDANRKTPTPVAVQNLLHYIRYQCRVLLGMSK